MEGQLRALGFSPAERTEEAQVVVLNTCSIREHAEEKVHRRATRETIGDRRFIAGSPTG